MRRALVVALALALLAACGDGLAFVRDDRLRIVSPRDRAIVRAPLVVEWQAERLPPGTVFGVFVDHTPMAPGEGLRALTRDDPICRTTPGCPDRAWLESRGVRLTRRSAVVVPVLLADSRRRGPGGEKRHEIAVVLLDDRGVRQGEAVWRRVVYAR